MVMIRQNSPYILIQTKFQYISLALWFRNMERGQFWSRSCAAFNKLHLSKNDMLHKHRACFGILIQFFGFANDPTSPFNTGAGKGLLKITFIMHIKMLQCKQDRQDNTFLKAFLFSFFFLSGEQVPFILLFITIFYLLFLSLELFMEITVFMCESFSQTYQDWFERKISTESL